jgi:hypothetical protein
VANIASGGDVDILVNTEDLGQQLLMEFLSEAALSAK